MTRSLLASLWCSLYGLIKRCVGHQTLAGHKGPVSHCSVPRSETEGFFIPRWSEIGQAAPSNLSTLAVELRAIIGEWSRCRRMITGRVVIGRSVARTAEDCGLCTPPQRHCHAISPSALVISRSLLPVTSWRLDS